MRATLSAAILAPLVVALSSGAAQAVPLGLDPENPIDPGLPPTCETAVIGGAARPCDEVYVSAVVTGYAAEAFSTLRFTERAAPGPDGTVVFDDPRAVVQGGAAIVARGDGGRFRATGLRLSDIFSDFRDFPRTPNPVEGSQQATDANDAALRAWLEGDSVFTGPFAVISGFVGSDLVAERILSLDAADWAELGYRRTLGTVGPFDFNMNATGVTEGDLDVALGPGFGNIQYLQVVPTDELRAPVRAGGFPIDLADTFGYEFFGDTAYCTSLDSQLANANCTNGARVSAVSVAAVPLPAGGALLAGALAALGAARFRRVRG